MWFFLFLLHLKFSHLIYFRSNALPPLDWPLPSQFDQYELRIEVQPRPHHRAHYETEGSRGAVKAAPTGHPVVKVKTKPESRQSFCDFSGFFTFICVI